MINTRYYGTFNIPVVFEEGFAFKTICAKQVSNPERWNRTHDIVDSRGFLLDRYEPIQRAFRESGGDGINKPVRKWKVVGNIYQNPDLITNPEFILTHNAFETQK